VTDTRHIRAPIMPRQSKKAMMEDALLDLLALQMRYIHEEPENGMGSRDPGFSGPDEEEMDLLEDILEAWVNLSNRRYISRHAKLPERSSLEDAAEKTTSLSSICGQQQEHNVDNSGDNEQTGKKRQSLETPTGGGAEHSGEATSVLSSPLPIEKWRQFGCRGFVADHITSSLRDMRENKLECLARRGRIQGKQGAMRERHEKKLARMRMKAEQRLRSKIIEIETQTLERIAEIHTASAERVAERNKDVMQLIARSDHDLIQLIEHGNKEVLRKFGQEFISRSTQPYFNPMTAIQNHS
jgi:hypothetical protein